MSDSVLDQSALNEALKTLDVEWSDLPGQGLVRVFEMPDFKSGFAFVTHIAKLAEQYRHHPELRLTYEQVEVKLITHSANGITAKDIELARAIDEVAD